MISAISIITILRSVAFALALHPLHVSVTEIEFDEKDKALEIMMRVFIDDLELTMRNRYDKPELDILNPPRGLVLNYMMADYLKDHFKIKLDNKSHTPVYLGYERDGEAFVFYIEVSNVKRWKTIEVFNDIIIETHEDQSNLVHVTVRGKVRSLRLTKSTPVDKLTFESK